MRAPLSFLPLLFAILLAPSLAAAEGFAVRARPAGLRWLAEVAREALPTRFELPPFERELFDCPFTEEDIRASVSNAGADIALHSLEVIPKDGSIEIRGTLDLHAGALIDLDNPHACTGDAVCQSRVDARSLSIGVEVGLTTTGEGRTEATFVDVSLGILPEDFELDSDGCFVGDALEWAFELVEGWALDVIIPRIEGAAEDAMLPEIQNALEGLGVQTFERGGFRFEGWLEGIEIAPDTGVTLSADGRVSFFDGLPLRDENVGARDVGPPTTRALPLEVDGSFQLAATDQRINEVLYEAWQARLFEIFVGGMIPTLELPADGVSQKLGLPPGTVAEVHFELGMPPVVTFGRDNPGVLLELNQLALRVHVQSPGAARGTLEVNMDAAVGVSAHVDPATGLLRMVPEDIRVGRLELTTPSDHLRADPARLTEFLRAVALPMLADKLAEVPLAPALMPRPDLFVLARHASASGGWLRVGVDLFRPDESDTEAPDTRFVDTPPFVGPALATLAVTGTDDTTPTELLQYQGVLDGVPIGRPSFAPLVRVTAADGPHTLDVYAIDVHGRADETPARHSFIVDGIPPTLEILEAPGTLLDDEELFVRWAAGDDRTAVETRWTLLEVGDGAERTTVLEDDFAPDRDAVRIGGLKKGGLYVLRVIARDEAGNITSEDVGFTRLGSRGCDAGGAGVGAVRVYPTALLLLLFLLMVRRRRRALASGLLALGALSALSLPGPAEAQVIGSHLAGPTAADTSAPFWNPGAMNAIEGTQLGLSLGFTPIRLQYTSDGPDGTSRTFVPTPELMLGAVTDALGDRFRLGISAGLLDASGAAWPRDGGARNITRYYAVDARTYSLGVIPAASVRLAPWFSFGGGLIVARSVMEAEIDIDMGAKLNSKLGSQAADAPFPYAHPDLAAPTELAVAGVGLGGVFGVLLEAGERVKLGASLHSPVKAHARGSVKMDYPERLIATVAEVAPGAALPEHSGSLSVPLLIPMRFLAGVSFDLGGGVILEADYRFQRTKTDRSLTLTVTEATSEELKNTTIVKSYRNRHGASLRLLHRFFDERALVGARVRYESSKVPDATLSPSEMDFHKVELGIIGQYRFSERFGLTAYYSHYFIPGRQIRESIYRPHTEPSLDSLNRPTPTGSYGADVDTVGLTATVYIE